MKYTTFFVLAVLLGYACGQQQPLSLSGSTWQLTAYEDQGKTTPASADRAGTLHFADSTGLQGSTGCNRYGGQYSLADGRLTATGVFSTKMACPGAADAQERVFFAVLNGKPQLEKAGNKLTLRTDQGQALHFVQSAGEGDGAAAEEEDPAATPAAAEVASRAAAAPVWRVLDQALVKRGMFAYMADAAVFFDCADGKRYPVAMEAGFPELERQYLQLMGEEAGRRAYLTVTASAVQRNKMDGEGKEPTLLVGSVYSLTRQADCDTEITRWGGSYTAAANGEQAMLRNCQTGETWPIANDGAGRSLWLEYSQKANKIGKPAYVEVEGFVLAGPALDGQDGADEYLHVTRVIGLLLDEGC